jgi:protein-S-isoprenylcysteine O-methyltransferase Ste14
MELFPNLKIGLVNGWILIAFFFGAYGAMLAFFPKYAFTRLYDRSGQGKRLGVRRLSAVILVLLWFVMVCLTPLKIGSVVFIIGILIYFLGLTGFLIALNDFKNTPVDEPVIKGLYRISRHPQQFSISIAFLGIGIATGSWLAFSTMLLGIIGAHKKILAEEEACLEQYGELYQKYMERVPRYFVFF